MNDNKRSPDLARIQEPWLIISDNRSKMDGTFILHDSLSECGFSQSLKDLNCFEKVRSITAPAGIYLFVFCLTTGR
jgi:hypothetical protein